MKETNKRIDKYLASRPRAGRPGEIFGSTPSNRTCQSTKAQCLPQCFHLPRVPQHTLAPEMPPKTHATGSESWISGLRSETSTTTSPPSLPGWVPVDLVPGLRRAIRSGERQLHADKRWSEWEPVATDSGLESFGLAGLGLRDRLRGLGWLQSPFPTTRVGLWPGVKVPEFRHSHLAHSSHHSDAYNTLLLSFEEPCGSLNRKPHGSLMVGKDMRHPALMNVVHRLNSLLESGLDANTVPLRLNLRC